jgi:hypothetical protein
VRWADLDRATQARGLATTGGTVSGVFLTGWEDPTQGLAQIAWTRQSSTLLRPFTTGGAYVDGVADGNPDEIPGPTGPTTGGWLR